MIIRPLSTLLLVTVGAVAVLLPWAVGRFSRPMPVSIATAGAHVTGDGARYSTSGHDVRPLSAASPMAVDILSVYFA